jgi:O-methyltransferase involved in polyketide biosynthesis
MAENEPLIRDISDTARWAAIYRAWETERPDAIFRDLFARRLAGERGAQIAQTLEAGNPNAWPTANKVPGPGQACACSGEMTHG